MLRSMIDATRRNHALEHGTVMIMLTQMRPAVRMVGRAVPDGFYIYGRVPTDLLTSCAHEALARFKRGETALAVTPLCGTNIAIGGIFSAVAAVLSMGRRPSIDKLPNACSAAMLGNVLSQPAGRWVQQYLTTLAELDEIEIVGVRRGLGGLVHKVQTTRRERPAIEGSPAVLRRETGA
jgi:hypothetical protein